MPGEMTFTEKYEVSKCLKRQFFETVNWPTTRTCKAQNFSVLGHFVLWFSYKQFQFKWLKKDLVSKSRPFFHVISEGKNQDKNGHSSGTFTPRVQLLQYFKSVFSKTKKSQQKKLETTSNPSACSYGDDYLSSGKLILISFPLMLNIHVSSTKEWCFSVLITAPKKYSVLNSNSFLRNGKNIEILNIQKFKFLLSLWDYKVYKARST